MDPLLTSNEAALALRVSQNCVPADSQRPSPCRKGRPIMAYTSKRPACNRSPGMSDVIYLDDNASNPMHPAVADAITAAMQNLSGNASSSHAAGVLARKAVEDARGQLAELLDVAPSELVFTSGQRNQITSSSADSPTPPARTAPSSLQANTPRSQVAHELQAEGVIDLSVVPLLPPASWT